MSEAKRHLKHIYGTVRPVKDHIIVQDMIFGERKLASGIIIPGDDGLDRGIRARWAKVYAVGPLQQDIKPGDWVLIKHGRWTRGVDITGPDGVTISIRRVDNADIFMTSDEKPMDDTVDMSN